jgi:tetratricopeptide (TPR) repeat protein
VSSKHIAVAILLSGLWGGSAAGLPVRGGSIQDAPNPSNSSTAAPSEPAANPASIFQAGQDALRQGHLDEAERDFRRVLELNPAVGGAYTNLGVIYMRRKQWRRALGELQKAEQMMPDVAGVRLNIGLAYYRQNDFLKAIPAFQSVVRDQPDALQPRYLLGLCYFFTNRWADSAATLEPLWPQESAQLSYLYVLSISAHRAGQKALDDRATAQLVKIGEGSPEYHLFMGKAHLNLEQYDLALTDFRAAAEANPRLTFVHFNMGLAYLKKQDYEHARDEFLKDAAIEPDLAFNYDQLGDVYTLMQQDDKAEKSYREALERDPRMLNSYVGLAKIYTRDAKYQQALTAIDSAVELDPSRTDIHYIKGRALIHLGHKEEGKKELEAAVRLDNEHRAEREKQVETGTVPSPEVLGDEP